MLTRIIATLALVAAIAGCGEGPSVNEESSQSPLSVPVGTHRAVGSYTCKLPFPLGSVTYSVSTKLYITQRDIPGTWYMDLTADVYGGKAVTIDRVAATPMESRDNGFVVYNTVGATLYVHRLAPFASIEYTHDEDAPPAAIQFWPADATHPLGQLVVSMYPKGNSDPNKGECAEAVGMYLTIQP